MSYQLSKMIVLVGLMGAGKSAIGNVVAQRLGVAFLDSDREIEAAAAMTIPEIFERDGEAFFRRREQLVLERLLKGQPGVLSTGGGAYLSADNRRLISELGVAVWLKADLELLWSRVRHKDTRPLLRVADPYAKLQELYNARTPIYENAEFVVEAEPNLSLEGMTSKVIETLLSSPLAGVRIVKGK